MIVPPVLVPVETVLCDVVRGVSTLPGVLLLCMEHGVDGWIEGGDGCRDGISGDIDNLSIPGRLG